MEQKFSAAILLALDENGEDIAQVSTSMKKLIILVIK